MCLQSAVPRRRVLGVTDPSSFPRTSAALREALERHGLRPTKMRGQCFLTDVQAVDAIVRDADVRPGDHVVEVGTGPGLLTHALCESGADVTSFEIDRGLHAFAQAQRTWPDRVRFVEADVLASKRVLSASFLEAIARPAARRLLVSNLPYNIATPLLLALLGEEAPPERMVVMVQLELGEKLLAPPSRSDRGAPSLVRELTATGRILRRFSPKVFWPRPKVQSALLELVPLPDRPLQPAHHDAFSRFVTQVFTRRRKVLPTAIQAALPGAAKPAILAAMASAGLDPTLRPQDTPAAALLAVYQTLTA